MGRKLWSLRSNLQVRSYQTYIALYKNPLLFSRPTNILPNSAIYYLHLSPTSSNSSTQPQFQSSTTPSSLRRTTRIVTDIALSFQQFLLHTRETDLGICPPLTLRCLYDASLTHISFVDPGGEEFRSGEWERRLNALRDMLGSLKGRWGLAGEFLCLFSYSSLHYILPSTLYGSSSITSHHTTPSLVEQPY